MADLKKSIYIKNLLRYFAVLYTTGDDEKEHSYLYGWDGYKFTEPVNSG